MICIEVRIFRAELRNFTRNTWKLPFSKPIFAIFRSKNFHCVVFTKKIQKYRGGKFTKLPHFARCGFVWKSETISLIKKKFVKSTGKIFCQKVWEFISLNSTHERYFKCFENSPNHFDRNSFMHWSNDGRNLECDTHIILCFSLNILF